MNLPLILAMLLLVNALLHIIQGFLYGFNKTTTPVVIWGLALAALGAFWIQQQPTTSWLKWTTFLMPLLGGFILTSQLSKSTNAKWIDYSIIGLDILTVATMIYILFIA